MHFRFLLPTIDQLIMASSGTTKNRRKLALVVGINEYDEFPSLRCSENDAKDMASALKRIGFEVTVKLGVNHKEMEHAIVDFKDSIEKGDIVVLFFAGHGVQWRVSFSWYCVDNICSLHHVDCVGSKLFDNEEYTEKES